jgi:hypothetical protein
LRQLIIFIIFYLSMPGFVSSQSYTYVNYDTKDGLASSVVYDICQDKDGFLWFATESGVSRFDGTHFRNFTHEDGLPSNSIIKVFADSKGRVWMSSLNTSVCYYYQGRIYNRQKDSLFGNIKLSHFIDQFDEDTDGNILMRMGWDSLLFLPVSANRNPVLLRPPLATFSSINNYPDKGFLVGNNDSIFRLIDTALTFWRPGNKADHKTTIAFISSIGEWTIPRLETTISLYSLRGRLRFVNTSAGSWEIDSVSGQYKELLLSGKNINQTFIDNENNLWFATSGEGIYRLLSKEYKTWSFKRRSPIFSITDWEGHILAGSEYSRLYHVRNNSIDTLVLYPYGNDPGWPGNNKYISKPGSHRAYVMKKMKNGDVLVGFDWSLALLSKGNKPIIKESVPVKSICQIDENTAIIGTAGYAALIDCRSLTILRKIRSGRSTAVHYSNGYYYIGTPEGLYGGKHPDSLVFLSNDIPESASLIACMADGKNGITWIATQEQGIMGIKENRLVAHFTNSKGLTSNICKTLCLDGDSLWIGTDKGLNVINLGDKNNPITTYTTADGLPFNNIDAVYVLDHTVYIGSPAGLTSFTPGNPGQPSTCLLKILDIVLGDSSVHVAPAYSMMFDKNSFKISYIAISYKSANNFIYYYRMKGLSKSWDSTYQTTLEFPSLPAGSYEFELVAKNRFGVQSKPFIFSLNVKAPYWQKTWFIIGILASVAALVCWITIIRFRRLRQKEWEKIRMRQKINDLEQRVQRAQMNPHFIFNCLNSIQNFIINSDIDATNQYLTEFSSLMRQTLDNSDKTSINIHNEIRYLKNYMELEKMRFGHHFTFLIEVDPGISNDSVYLPVMFLQPYIENSIRHGLRNKKDSPGFIKVQFEQSNSYLTCVIEDNGVGRKKGMESKSRIGQAHFSKGTTLNIERMNTLNEYYGEKMTIETVDLFDEKNEPTGTRVIICFPFSTLEKLNPYDTNSNYRR